MHWNGEVTLGNLLTIITLISLAIAAWYGLKARILVFQEMLRTHSQTLMDHAKRLDTYESRILDLVSGLQRLIGQSEVFRRENRNQ